MFKRARRFEKGEYVECINAGSRYGAGWKLGLKFTITTIDRYSEEDCCFGGYQRCGVFEKSLRLARRNEWKGNIKSVKE